MPCRSARATDTVRFDLISIFPDYFAPLRLSLMGKAEDAGLVQLQAHDLRNWATGKHRSVDDTPYGGGAGMVMRADVWARALDEVLSIPLPGSEAEGSSSSPRRVLAIPTPSGTPLTQPRVEDLARADQIIVACGRYEGIDARVAEHYRDAGVEVRELSIGDYVLGGGEAAASRWAGDWKRRATTHVPAAISAAPARSAAHGRRRRTGFTGFRPLP